MNNQEVHLKTRRSLVLTYKTILEQMLLLV